MAKKALSAEHEHLFRQIVEEAVPFNKHLGLKIEDLNHEHPKIRLDMRPELIGNTAKGILHGGVITSTLDMMGGLAIMLDHLAENNDLGAAIKIGTINLHVDFLSPGRGKFFIASGRIVRRGQRIAVVHMEFHNDTGVLIATGVGAYNLG